MPTLRHVLVALSLDAGDSGLLRYAAMVAKLRDVQRFDFVHVLPVSENLADTSALEAAAVRLRTEMTSHFGQPREGLSINHRIVQGARIDAILRTASELSSDVVLLGHRKSRSGRRSLARRLAALAPCSVWLAPEGCPAQLNSILVPIDFSEHAADSLSMATYLAAQRGIEECFALHIFFDPSTVRYDEHIEEIRGDEQRAFARFMQAIDCHGVRVEPLFEESTHVPEAILRVAARQSTDLIVMNTRGRSRAAAVLLGSVTSDAIAKTHIPLLAVKHFGAAMRMLEALTNKHFWDRPEPKTN